jgi:hypothetical protein
VGKEELVKNSIARVQSKQAEPETTAPIVEQPILDNSTPPPDAYTPMSEQELDQVAHDVNTYGDKWTETAGITALGELTAGAVPRLLQNIGAYEPGEIAKMQENNPYAEPVGEAVGLGLGLLTGGEGLVAKGMQKSAVGLAESGGRVAERVVSDLIKKSANKTLNKEIIRKSVEHAARGAAEGTILNVADLANEDAIGKAEFNAENLMGAAGTGALFGGLTSAAFPVIGAGGRAIGRGSKEIFDKSLSKITDPVKDTLKLFGYAPKDIAEIATSDAKKEFREGLIPWLSSRLDAKTIKSDEDILTALTGVNQEARKGADSILTELGQDVAGQPGLVQKGKEVFETVISNVNRTLEEKSKYGFSEEAINKLVKFRNSVQARLESGKAFEPAEYRSFRQSLDEMSKWGKSGAEHPVMVQVARENRQVFSNAMHDLAATINPEKADKLKKYFEDMHYSIDMIDNLGNKIGKSDDKLPFKLGEIFRASGMVHLLGTAGGILAAGEAVLSSDLKKRLVIMQAMRKAGQKTEAMTKSSIEKFLSNSKLPRKIETASALMAAHIARPEGSKSAPKSRQEAYENTAKNLNELMTNPEKLMDKTAKATASISREAPKTASVASQRIINATQFLASKLPKSPSLAVLPGVKPRPYTPSSMELAKFERYIQIVEMPLSILNELEHGTLTKDHVEAMQAVYPEMYNYFRNSLINKLQSVDNVDMPYSKRVQAGLLLDIVSDSSMLPHNISALQQNFKVNEQPEGGAAPVVSPTQTGAAQIDKADRSASDTQAFMQRRSEG